MDEEFKIDPQVHRVCRVNHLISCQEAARPTILLHYFDSRNKLGLSFSVGCDLSRPVYFKLRLLIRPKRYFYNLSKLFPIIYSYAHQVHLYGVVENEH